MDGLTGMFTLSQSVCFQMVGASCRLLYSKSSDTNGQGSLKGLFSSPKKQCPDRPVLTKAYSRTVECYEDIHRQELGPYRGIPVFPVWSDTDQQ